MATQLSESQINRELAQYETDLSWVLENYASLIKKYGNEFIAVLNQTVLSHASTIQELKDELSSKFKADAHRVVIEFIYPEHPNFVLAHADYLQA
jgi:hypothetical protein